MGNRQLSSLCLITWLLSHRSLVKQILTKNNKLRISTARGRFTGNGGIRNGRWGRYACAPLEGLPELGLHPSHRSHTRRRIARFLGLWTSGCNDCGGEQGQTVVGGSMLGRTGTYHCWREHLHLPSTLVFMEPRSAYIQAGLTDIWLLQPSHRHMSEPRIL